MGNLREVDRNTGKLQGNALKTCREFVRNTGKKCGRHRELYEVRGESVEDMWKIFGNTGKRHGRHIENCWKYRGKPWKI